ncbi:GntR family transcriptional regulator [Xanthobacter dioxanivorans]|uniref:GntR family transcriptional regulator n=1 Tax=Xanthobacter dioxanivorans TaxID=2528964 RepID=A0A974PMK7_9HYPH|nr:GntR family transcriptional regulator [Xanthobacter dioxanivorans]QRG06373.1 GntR family transcriptional regulator [Xanthobacter dioxanivorans]
MPVEVSPLVPEGPASTATPKAERQAPSGISPRLHERAFDILAAQIASGVLVTGERLLESRVAERFGISRAPARQALARLERLGLVRRAEGHGFIVERLSGTLSVSSADVAAGDAPVQLAPEASWERIYRSVEQEVVARTAFGAWRVVENHLAAHYGVSRTVAREVLSRLHQRGVVRKDARLHWHAPALTPAYVAELFDMRAILEPAALLRAFPHLPTETIPRLRSDLLDAMETPSALDAARLSGLEEDLHVGLIGHCGNATLMEALGTCHTLLVALTFLYSREPRFHAQEPVLPEHLAVVEHLAAGHPDAAAEALRDHLKGSFGRALERLDRVRRDFVPEPVPYLVAV